MGGGGGGGSDEQITASFTCDPNDALDEISCTDPESFVRGSPTLTDLFLV